MGSSALQGSEGGANPAIVISQLKQVLETNWPTQQKSLRSIFSRARRDPHLSEQLRFSEQLLQRAPASFLNRTNIATLSAIVSETWDAYQTFLSGDDKFLLRLSNRHSPDERAHLTSLITVTQDRTFIIDTLQELLHSFKLTFRAILHPIIDAHGQSVSVVYLEFDRLEDSERQQEFLQLLQHTFSDLLLATDDFHAMLARVREVQHGLQRSVKTSRTRARPSLREDPQETAEFLDFVTKEHFIYLGYRRWFVTGNGEDAKIVRDDDADLGLFKSHNPELSLLSDNSREAQYLATHDDLFLYSRSFPKTRIHRHHVMTVLSFKTTSADGTKTLIHSFVGLLRYFFLEQNADLAPLTRRKLEIIIAEDKIKPHSFDYRETFSVFRGLPRTRLLQADAARIREDMQLVLRAKESPVTCGNFYFDTLDRFCSVLLVVPRNRFSDALKATIQQFIEQRLEIPEGTSEIDVAVIDHRLLKVHYLLPNFSFSNWRSRMSELVDEVVALTLTWDDRVAALCAERNNYDRSRQDYARYIAALPPDYKAATDPGDAARDIEVFESLKNDDSLEVLIEPKGSPGRQRGLVIKVYKRGGQLTLSEVLPHLDAAGFTILRNIVTECEVDCAAYTLFSLEVEHQTALNISERQAKQIIIPGLKQILSGACVSDRFTALLVTPGLEWREIAILRTLAQYLMQIIGVTERQIISAIINNADVVRATIDFFRIKFDPQLHPSDDNARTALRTSARERLTLALRAIRITGDEEILSALASIVDATVRTNFYQLNSDLRIALKVQCSQTVLLADSSNSFEYFIYAPEFQAIYVTAGRLARGRIKLAHHTDYRKEALDGVSTQELLQAGIAPAGACGCFTLQRSLGDESEDPARIAQAFGWFFFGLLQLTDNVDEGGTIVHPEKVVCYDGNEPYLMISMDETLKEHAGIASEIARRDFGYWLADECVVGGAAVGTTAWYEQVQADGAWIAASQHARAVGLRLDDTPPKVVAYGGPQDRVLWKTLLQKNNLHLVAAFDRTHIFIDPNASEGAQHERARLFEGTATSWADYDSKQLGAGGGIYSTSAREIELSDHAQALFKFSQRVVSGPALAQAILRLPCDIIFFGRTQVLVKSVDESALIAESMDAADCINGRELRAKIAIELGESFTQGGRIEFAKIGGHINGPTVDNAAVIEATERFFQTKLALRQLVAANQLSSNDETALIETCTREIQHAMTSRARVLSHALSIAVRRSRDHLDEYLGLAKLLEHAGLLERVRDGIPDDETFHRRQVSRSGLPRPSVERMVNLTKIWLFDALVNSRFTGDPLTEQLLAEFFPNSICQRFPEILQMHPLRRELIAAQIVNIVVDAMGPNFVQRHMTETGAHPIEIVRAFLAARFILSVQNHEESLSALDTHDSIRIYHRGQFEIRRTLDAMARWLLETRKKRLKLHELVARYREPFRELYSNNEMRQQNIADGLYHDRVQRFLVKGFPAASAESLASLFFAPWCLDIVEISLQVGRSPAEVARVYSAVMKEFDIQELLEQAHEVRPKSRWDTLAAQATYVRIQRSVSAMTTAIIDEQKSTAVEAVKDYFVSRRLLTERFQATRQELTGDRVGVPALIVLSSQLASFTSSRLPTSKPV